MILYIHTKCSTCKEAIHFLEKKKIAFTVKDIVKEPPSLLELQTMLEYQHENLKKLLNTSGQLYREMELSKKLDNLSTSAVLELLNQHGMLIKRPFLLDIGVGLVGFNEKIWTETVKQLSQ